MFSILLALYLFAIVISIGTAFYFGKIDGGITSLALIVFQGLFSIEFAPVVLVSGITITPGINIGFITAILLLLFAPKNIKIGAAAYLITGILVILVFLSLQNFI